VGAEGPEQQLGFMGSQKIMKVFNPKESEKLVLDQMSSDPTGVG
jgi:hypothetical protein